MSYPARRKWAFPEKIVPPCWGYRFFWSWLFWILDFRSNLLWPLWNFPFFYIDPLEIHVFLQFLVQPLEFERLLLYPLDFFIDILNRGGGYNVSFSKSPISQNTNKRYFYHILFGCSIICFPLIHFAGTASVTLSEKKIYTYIWISVTFK